MLHMPGLHADQLTRYGPANINTKMVPEKNSGIKGLSTREAGRGHATPHMPVETAKCWWLLKIEPNAWAGGKGSCAVCVDLQAGRSSRVLW